MYSSGVIGRQDYAAIGLFLEIALGAVAVLLALIAVIVRVARAI
jgi:hypothetical protein